MNIPEAFHDEYWKMRERIEWAQAALGREQDVRQAKTVVDEYQTFYDRWRPIIKAPEFSEALDAVQQHVEVTLKRALEKIFLSHLHEVIEARKDWLMSEQLFKLSINFIKLMKHAPPQMRPALERIHRDHLQKEFDPETHYREAEEDTVQEEANFRKALAGLEVDWPERVDDALRARLEKLDITEADLWQQELGGKTEQLSDPPGAAPQDHRDPAP